MALQFFVLVIHELHDNIFSSQTSGDCSSVRIVAHELSDVITSNGLNFFIGAGCQCNKKLQRGVWKRKSEFGMV